MRQLKHFKNVIICLAILFISFADINDAIGQKKDTISDFYEYVNKAWIDSITLSEHASVVNNWGILWEEITAKSIEILSGDSQYDLDEEHHFVLTQLQNFYKSTIEYSNDDNERIKLVQQYFPMQFGILFSKITITQTKEEMINEIINYLTLAYFSKIETSELIGNYYKNLYLSKLDEMEFEIGAPALAGFAQIPKLSSDSLEKNIELAKKYQLDNLNNAGWETPPFETDCRYSFNQNKVKIYAGILYDPHFEEKDVACIFASIGRTIAHEMTHAFDKTGKTYDENGKHMNWFKRQFSGALFSKNDCDKTYGALIEQYGQYTIQDSLSVDGKKPLQENFADFGGLEVSLLALKLYLKDKQSHNSDEETSKSIKAFFIAYAQFWREKSSPEFERYTLQRAHTPQKYRAIGPTYNQDEFYKVFELDKNSKFYIPVNMRIRIW